MKIRRIGMHLFYLLVIFTLLIGLFGLNRLRSSAKERLRETEEMHQKTQLTAFSRLCAELSGDLYSISEADTKKIYVMKLSEMQIASGQALLLLSENGRQTPWITFWQSLEAYLSREMERVIESEQIDADQRLWSDLAKVMGWLSENPKALLDESTESLPDDLRLPILQTAYGVEEEKTQRVAERVIGVRGGLRTIKNCPPGIRSYACTNGRVDVLQSGELLYFTLQLEPKTGETSDQEAEQIFLDFAKAQGLGMVALIDLYREDGLIRGKLAPMTVAEQLGKIPDLDRTMEIACTQWSGKVCYFSAGKFFTATKPAAVGLLLSEAKVEKIAAERAARVGPPFRYMGRVCRGLIYQRGGFAGRSVLCIDASTGEQVDLFYIARPSVGEKRLF